MKMSKKIILLGPPGSGKGTQAKKISEFYKIPHVSTGEILRQTVSTPSRLAKRIRTYMNKGELVPDRIIFSIIRRRLKKTDTKIGFVLDGFPRNIQQARVLDKILNENSGVNVFNLEVKTGTIIRRLSKRRVCKSCGSNYHMEFQPPKVDEKCDRCAVALYQRDDDKPLAIRNRLKVYEKESRPLAEYYRKKGFLISVKGEGSEEEIFSSIRKHLK